MLSPVAALVTITEGLDFVPEVAFLAAALGSAGVTPRRVAIDFCTSEEFFAGELRALRPALVVVAYSGETAEIADRLAVLAAASGPFPVVLFGDAVATRPAKWRWPEGVQVGAEGLDRALGSLGLPAASAAAEGSSLALDVGFFGGEALSRTPMAASLFGEPGVAALVATRPARRTLSPTAALARLEAASPAGPLTLDPGVALAPLEGLGAGLRRVAFWDRNGDAPVLAAVAGLRDEARRRGRRLRQDVRVVPFGDPARVLQAVADAGASRVVFEADRVLGAPPLPGSVATVEDLAPWRAAAHARGLEVGVLFVVGLPGETRSAGRDRVARLRELAPDRLRCVPFEPTRGHEAERFLRDAGSWPPPGELWIREVHRPLRQACLSTEEFTANWTDALVLLAELEVARTDG